MLISKKPAPAPAPPEVIVTAPDPEPVRHNRHDTIEDAQIITDEAEAFMAPAIDAELPAMPQPSAPAEPELPPVVAATPKATVPYPSTPADIELEKKAESEAQEWNEQQAQNPRTDLVAAHTNLTLSNTNSREQLLAWGAVLATSGKFPNITSAESAVATIMLARDLKLPEMLALTQMHIIEGKPSLSLNLIQYLLDINKVVLTMDYDYEYFENPATGKPDFMTRITFRDPVKYPQGVTYTMWYSEAELAEWTKKPNWKKMPRLMLRSRVITSAARLFYAAFLGGAYEVGEMVDAGKADPNTYALESQE